MRNLLLPALLLLTTFSSFSQTLKIKADIVFANNDSLSAEVLDEQLRDIQKGIKYRDLDSENFKTAYPDQLKSVKFADGRLLETVKTDSVSCLLLNLIQGYYNLYEKFENFGLMTFYLRHAQDEPIHLTETFLEKEIGSKSVKVSNYEYVHKLTNAMADNLSLSTEINTTKFSEYELISIVKKYNEFKGNKYSETDYSQKKSTKIDKGILIFNYLDTKDYRVVNLIGVPGVGMSFDFRRNNHYEKFALKTRISISLEKFENWRNQSWFMITPIMVSYNYLNFTRFQMDILGGISPWFYFVTKNHTYT